MHTVEVNKLGVLPSEITATCCMMMSRVQEVDRAAGAGRCPSERSTFAFIGERTRPITTALTWLHHHAAVGFWYDSMCAY
ncbi:unnamed protein product [Pieris macdunnoughi]|uniref:Uncharacterized protein n=1 Tax=Pieris macdunnoughi TaxID=345717 RepID=A0A821MTE3_9NEOP|nr:unnamed protein product [Pieris macdunnoughi]